MTGTGDQSNTPPDPPDAGRPIFILGILPRCGTNWLAELLLLHPDCAAPANIAEDFLVSESDRLVEYARAVYGRWNPAWGVTAAAPNELLVGLGGGLVAFLRSRTPAPRIVTKTPRIDRVEHFFRVFPNASLVILVRDGRSVVESGVRSFGWVREAATQRWAQAARSLMAFEASHTDPRYRYRVVRYEDLWQDLAGTLGDLLDFLELDRTRYDFAQARALPLYGSSEVRAGSGSVHWRPVEKQPGFDPTARWRAWGGARHARFNAVGGDALAYLGYERRDAPGPRWFWWVWNRLHDVKWVLMRTLGPLFLRLTRRPPPPR